MPPWDVPFMACSMVNFSTGQSKLPEYAFSQGHSFVLRNTLCTQFLELINVNKWTQSKCSVLVKKGTQSNEKHTMFPIQLLTQQPCYACNNITRD